VGGCSLDYEQLQMAEERDESVPETVVTEADFTVVRSGARSFRISAERAETYPEREEQILTGLSFEELGADGEVITSGAADRAVHDTATDDVTMSGNISFYSREYEARVRTGYLAWNNEEKVLRGRDDGQVRLELDSGTVIEGTGFEADMRRSIARFAESVQGVLVTDEE
jgi:LPS export ABC transporter protein LptC